MKLNKFFMLGLAGLAFAACSSEDEDVLTQNTKQVSVTIQSGAIANSRATQDALTEGTTIKSDDIDIYFLDASGKIVLIESMGAETTKTFHHVDMSVTQIAAVGNFKPTGVTVGTANFSDVQNSQVDVTKYQNGAANVPIYAAPAKLIPAGTDETQSDQHEAGKTYNLYKASLTLTTMMSRIEVGGNLNCENLGNAYSKLTLTHVGINNAFQKYALSTGIGTDLYEAKDNALGFPVTGQDAGNTPTVFFDAVTPNIEMLAASTSYPLGKFYAYNVVDDMPKFTFKFDPEIVDNPTIRPNNPAYLKIVGMKNAQDGGTVTMAPGHIYTITNLTFKEEDLTPLVNDGICVQATVEVTPWIIVAVEPEYGE